MKRGGPFHQGVDKPFDDVRHQPVRPHRHLDGVNRQSTGNSPCAPAAAMASRRVAAPTLANIALFDPSGSDPPSLGVEASPWR